MDDSQYFDRLTTNTIDQTIWGFDQLTNLKRRRFRYATARFRKHQRMMKAEYNPIDRLLGVDRRREADVHGNRAELIDRVLRPAEHSTHDARRIRLRTRSRASS